MKVKKKPQPLENFFFSNILYLLLGFFALYNLLAFAAPTLYKLGATGLSKGIYHLYSNFCHQMPERSIFLYGDQLTYTPEELLAAGFKDALEDDLLEHQKDSKYFYGSPELGYKVAFCVRDTGIYLAMLIVLIIVTFTKIQFKVLPTWVKVLFAVPMALDGGIQFISALLYYSNTIDALFYESTIVKRLITGALFGFAMGTLIFPYIKKETTLSYSVDQSSVPKNGSKKHPKQTQTESK